MPKKHCGLITIRTTVALQGLSLTNGVGIIDSDYHGEVKILLTNNTNSDIILTPGDRFAQLIILPTFSGEIVVNRYQTIRELIGELPPAELARLDALDYWNPVGFLTRGREDDSGSINWIEQP
jgi:hypothetical protein